MDCRPRGRFFNFFRILGSLLYINFGRLTEELLPIKHEFFS